MTERKPVLSDTKRPPKNPATERWLRDADMIRAALAAGKRVRGEAGGEVVIEDSAEDEE